MEVDKELKDYKIICKKCKKVLVNAEKMKLNRDFFKCLSCRKCGDSELELIVTA